MPRTPVERLKLVKGIGLDAVAAATADRPAVLRLENLDTDLLVPPLALATTRRALEDDASNSWLPLTGRSELRQGVAERLRRQTGLAYDPQTQIVVTCGGMEGLLDALLATVEAGSEVIVTDPTYAGMINRVHLVGALPVFVPFHDESGAWRLDLERLAAAVTPRTAAVFLMNPSMPSGAVLNEREWGAVAELCRRHDLWLLYNAAMEEILYDGRALLHPATLPGMAERTLVIGSASKALRMIGWKVGWVAGPPAVMGAVATAHIYNTADPVGIAQLAVASVLNAPEADSGVAAAVAEWQRRRDLICAELAGYRVVPAAGGWSLLLDVARLGFTSQQASERLLARGDIAATYMRDWGAAQGDRHVRLVFSNEPLQRLQGLGQRVRRALG